MDIEAYRNSEGLSQVAFGSLIGLRSKGYVSKLERRKVPVSIPLALRIEKVTGGKVPAKDLLSPELAALLPASSNETAKESAA